MGQRACNELFVINVSRLYRNGRGTTEFEIFKQKRYVKMFDLILQRVSTIAKGQIFFPNGEPRRRIRERNVVETSDLWLNVKQRVFIDLNCFFTKCTNKSLYCEDFLSFNAASMEIFMLWQPLNFDSNVNNKSKRSFINLASPIDKNVSYILAGSRLRTITSDQAVCNNSSIRYHRTEITEKQMYYLFRPSCT